MNSYSDNTTSLKDVFLKTSFWKDVRKLYFIRFFIFWSMYRYLLYIIHYILSIYILSIITYRQATTYLSIEIHDVANMITSQHNLKYIWSVILTLTIFCMVKVYKRGSSSDFDICGHDLKQYSEDFSRCLLFINKFYK